MPRAPQPPVIYTVGHSTRRLADFMALLASFAIEMVADIRRFPGSRKFPQFNQEPLAVALADHGIGYVHLRALGGKRKPRPDSPNTRWRNTSFRAYADYMDTAEFATALAELETLARQQRTALLCAEAVWWRCHRSLIADALKAAGWEVRHIMASGKAVDHPWTKPARIVNGKLSYVGDSVSSTP